MGAALVLLLVALGALAAGVLIGRYYVPDDRQIRRTARHSRSYMRALSHLVARDYDTVMTELVAVLEENVEEVEPYFALGALFRSRGEHERAIRVHQALAMRERERRKLRQRAMYELGLDFRAAGMPRRATRAMESVLAEEPEHEGALRTLAALYEEQARFGEAAGLWQRIGRQRGEDTRHREHHLLVAAAQAALGGSDLDSARQLLKAAQKIEESPHFFAAAAELAAARGNHRGARERLRQALSAEPGLAPHLLPGLIAAEQMLVAQDASDGRGDDGDDGPDAADRGPDAPRAQLPQAPRPALAAASSRAWHVAPSDGSTGASLGASGSLSGGLASPGAIAGAPVVIGGGLASPGAIAGAPVVIGGGLASPGAIAGAPVASGGSVGVVAPSPAVVGASGSSSGEVASPGGIASAPVASGGSAGVVVSSPSAIGASGGLGGAVASSPSAVGVSGNSSGELASPGAIASAPVASGSPSAGWASAGDGTVHAPGGGTVHTPGGDTVHAPGGGTATGAGERVISLPPDAGDAVARVGAPADRIHWMAPAGSLIGSGGAVSPAGAQAVEHRVAPGDGVALVPAGRPAAAVVARVLAVLRELEAQSGPRLELALIRAELLPPADVRGHAALAAELVAQFPGALAARVAAARLALVRGDAEAVRGALDGLVGDGGALAWTLRGRWQCAHCGHRPGPFSWRCAQCRRWGTLRMETGIEPAPVPPRERRAAPRPLRAEGLLGAPPDQSLPAPTLDAGLSDAELARAGARRSLRGRVGAWWSSVWRRPAP